MYFYGNFGHTEASTARQVPCQPPGEEMKINIITLDIVFEKSFIYLLFTAILMRILRKLVLPIAKNQQPRLYHESS